MRRVGRLVLPADPIEQAAPGARPVVGLSVGGPAGADQALERPDRLVQVVVEAPVVDVLERIEDRGRLVALVRRRRGVDHRAVDLQVVQPPLERLHVGLVVRVLAPDAPVALVLLRLGLGLPLRLGLVRVRVFLLPGPPLEHVVHDRRDLVLQQDEVEAPKLGFAGGCVLAQPNGDDLSSERRDELLAPGRGQVHATVPDVVRAEGVVTAMRSVLDAAVCVGGDFEVHQIASGKVDRARTPRAELLKDLQRVEPRAPVRRGWSRSSLLPPSG